MQLGDVLVKISNNEALSVPEQEFLRLEGNRTQNANTLTEGFTKLGQAKLDIKLPLEVIYSEILQTAVASVSVQIPPEYRHILIMGAGRVSAAVYSQAVELYFNNDQSAIYRDQYTGAHNGTALNGQFAGATSLLLGDFCGTTAAAGATGTLFAFVTHAQSTTLHKGVISLRGAEEYSATDLLGLTVTGYYQSTNPLTSATLFSGVANFVAGSVFSFYGIR